MAADLGQLGIVEIYRRSKKPRDNFWNEWVSRPPAAVLVYLLRATPLTPNQVTFLSLAVALAADATLLLWRDHWGLVAGALLVQAAFIFDCVDGQLARIRGTASPVGGLLDFLMDEVKAVALVAAVAGRLGWQGFERGDPAAGALWLAAGLAGVVVASSGISLTTFMRRPEYVTLTRGAPPPPADPGEVLPAPPGPRRSLLGRLIGLLEWAGKSVLHYPQWFWVPALLGRIEWFLVPYLAAHTLHLGRAGLMVLWRLGRPAR